MATRKSAAYKALKAYIRFMVEKVYYRKSHYLDVGNLPEDGTPILIVSNHQNCLNDAVGIYLGVNLFILAPPPDGGFDLVRITEQLKGIFGI